MKKENHKLQFFKNIVFLILLLILPSCATYKKTPEQNMLDFKEGRVGAVISGCRAQHFDYPLFSRKLELLQIPCHASWRNFEYNKKNIKKSLHSHWNPFEADTATFYGFMNIQFLEPGTYRFLEFSASLDTSRYVAYSSKDKSSIFTDFTVKAGEVIYIGDLFVDLAKSTKLVLHSFSMRYYKLDNIQIDKKYAELEYKIQNRYVTLTESAAFAKKYIPILVLQTH
ncbi:MAG: hypothetical protein ACI8ZF_000894 [Candidatus Midichloriaceae bacterium]